MEPTDKSPNPEPLIPDDFAGVVEKLRLAGEKDEPHVYIKIGSDEDFTPYRAGAESLGWKIIDDREEAVKIWRIALKTPAGHVVTVYKDLYDSPEISQMRTGILDDNQAQEEL